jgi:D-alanine-D-alanine ligase-like ATP-grasp enzyme
MVLLLMEPGLMEATMQKEKYVLVVDLLSSAEYLAERFVAEGYGVIVLSTLDLLFGKDYCSYDKLDCVVIKSTHDVAEDLALLQPYQDKLIGGFYGSEISVAYADKILNKLFPSAANSCATSDLRCNKYAMVQAMSKNGDGIAQVKAEVDDVARSIALADEFLQKYGAIVIKPAACSAASLGVFAPKNLAEIEHYFHAKGHFMSAGGCYVIQEKINIATEFYVDCVSSHGEHLIVNIGKYKKNAKNGCFEYVYADKIELDAADAKLKQYALQVLHNLDMQNGMSHIEIALDDQGRYRLIELNPRASGGHGCINRMTKNSGQPDQVDAYIALLNKYELKETANQGKRYQRLIFLRSENYKNVIDELSCVTNCYHLNPHKVTEDGDEGYSMLADCYGFLILAGDNQQCLDDDTSRV